MGADQPHSKAQRLMDKSLMKGQTSTFTRQFDISERWLDKVEFNGKIRQS